MSTINTIMLVAGARPNFMKLASVVDAFAALEQQEGNAVEVVVVHTGQHYDETMSNSFFTDLRLPTPDINLGVGSSSHAVQTAEVMCHFERVLLDRKPDVVVVFGDVNSTIACSLVAAKIVYPEDAAHRRPLVAHVEAGLRSFDREMPEEVNRILTDALSDLLFVSEESGCENLRAEGVLEERIHFVGNTMVDTLLAHRDRAAQSDIVSRLGLESNESRGYSVVTLHRPSNVDDRATLSEIVGALAELAQSLPVLFPAHPRTRSRIAEFELESCFESTAQSNDSGGRITLLPPLGYLDFVCLVSNASLVLTDSGGIQEETTVLQVPCVTLRLNTERPATVDAGSNVLTPPKRRAILAAARSQIARAGETKIPELWDGQAGKRIVAALMERVGR